MMIAISLIAPRVTIGGLVLKQPPSPFGPPKNALLTDSFIPQARPVTTFRSGENTKPLLSFLHPANEALPIKKQASQLAGIISPLLAQFSAQKTGSLSLLNSLAEQAGIQAKQNLTKLRGLLTDFTKPNGHSSSTVLDALTATDFQKMEEQFKVLYELLATSENPAFNAKNVLTLIENQFNLKTYNTPEQLPTVFNLMAEQFKIAVAENETERIRKRQIPLVKHS
jgi:hypothetical protein